MRERIINVMNYKRPAFWLVAACVVICGVLVVGFITNPRMDAPITADFTIKVLHYRKLPILDESKVKQFTFTGESAGITQEFYKAYGNTGTDVWDYFTYGSADAAEGHYSYIAIGGVKYDLGFVACGDGSADKDYVLKNHGLKSTRIKWDTPVYQLNRTFGLAAMTTSYLTIKGGVPYIILDTSGWGEQYDLDADGIPETTANVATGTSPDYVIYEWEQNSNSIRCIQLTDALDCDVVAYLAEENLFYASDWNEGTATYEPALAYAYRDGKLIPQK